MSRHWLGAIVSGPEFAKNNETRQEAVRLSRQITTALQQPESVAVELASSTLVPMSARIVVDLGLFKHLVDAHRPLTAADLASLSGAEELFIKYLRLGKRILRPLAATHFVKEVAEDTWEATPVSEAMTQDGIAAGHRMLWEMLIGAAAKAPNYFKESGHRCPTNPQDGLMQYAFQTKLHFRFLQHNVSHHTRFQYVHGEHYGHTRLLISEQILNGATKEYPLIVDVGGGKGHHLQAFHEKFPAKGRLILQDLPHVLGEIVELDPAIERMACNFFEPQPIKNARVYLYHHILHDWSNYKCLEILQVLKGAMKPGYSKVLLHEMIALEQGATSFHARLDLTMMAFNSALLDSAGFDVVNMWSHGGDADGIIEAMVKTA
ncbi:Sterigmatocystin 8-O-methyltransferase protein [Rutstroemia sp. NJR-2017a BVV2]|nr:Sterigmatocystin 8-O-methyltransferase protein [Rutstroemia sp. NJR-2017a BVV2]